MGDSYMLAFDMSRCSVLTSIVSTNMIGDHHFSRTIILSVKFGKRLLLLTAFLHKSPPHIASFEPRSHSSAKSTSIIGPSWNSPNQNNPEHTSWIRHMSTQFLSHGAASINPNGCASNICLFMLLVSVWYTDHQIMLFFINRLQIFLSLI